MDDVSSRIDAVSHEKDSVKKARLIESFIKEKNVQIKTIASKLGKSSSYICHLLRLTHLPEMVIDGYYAHSISLSHLFVISRLKNRDEEIAAYEKILSDALTIRELDEYVREKIYRIKTIGERIDDLTKKTIEQKYKKIDPALEVKIIQTRIQTTLILKIKGNLKKTSEALQKIANRAV